MNQFRRFPASVIVLGAATVLSAQMPQSAADWPSHGRDPGAARYSPLTQIDTKNVSKLKLVWTYDTPAEVPPPPAREGGAGGANDENAPPAGPADGAPDSRAGRDARHSNY